MAAQIQFDQGALHPPGGQALQGVTGVLVTGSHSGGGVITTYTWTMVSVPVGSVVPVGFMASTPTVSFTPDLVGGYLLQLTIVETIGLISVTTTDVRAVLIPQDSVYNRIIAPFNAPGSALNVGGQTRGWSPFMENYLHLLDRLGDWSPTPPTVGQFASYVGGVWTPVTLTLSGAGDWSGLVSSNTVDKIKGASLPALTPVLGDTHKLLQVSGAATLTYALLLDANVDPIAAIAGSKITPNFAAQNVLTSADVSGGTVHVTGLAGLGAGYATVSNTGLLGFDLTIPAAGITNGTADQLLDTNHTGTGTEWFTPGGDVSFASHNFIVTQLRGAALPVTTPVLGDIYKVLQVSGAATLTYALVADANIALGAAIAGGKITPSFGAQTMIGQNAQITALSKGTLGVDVSGNVLVEVGLPLPSSLTLIAGLFNSSLSTPTRIGSRYVDLSAFPTTLSDGRTLTATFEASIETTLGSCNIRLWNVTDGEVVTGSILATSNTSNTKVSAPLTVGVAAGNLKTGKVYEIDIWISGGGVGDQATCTEVHLLLSYA